MVIFHSYVSHYRRVRLPAGWSLWSLQEAYEKTVGVGGKLDNILTAGVPRYAKGKFSAASATEKWRDMAG